MDQSESNTHSFIVKIWLEDASEENPIRWRGRILHVPDNTHRYFENLDVVAAFIGPYLEVMGADPGVGRRVRRWLNRWKQLLSWKA